MRSRDWQGPAVIYAAQTWCSRRGGFCSAAGKSCVRLDHPPSDCVHINQSSADLAVLSISASRACVDRHCHQFTAH